jgi:LPXTG-motif cell wall-anchored protein
MFVRIRRVPGGEDGMRKPVLLLVAALFGVVGAAGGVAGSASADNVPNEGVCQPQDAHITPPANTKEVVVTAPEGQVITGYCVKAGSILNENGPVYVNFDAPDQPTTVKITYPGGKDISHYVVFYGPAPVKTKTTPVKPLFTDPTCDVPGSVEQLADTEEYSYSYSTVGTVVTVTATAEPGFVLENYTGPWIYETAQQDCVDNPPTDNPPVVESGGPVPPAPVVESAAGGVAVQPNATTLPATGNSSWALALSAFAMLAVGSGLRRISRRSSESTLS